MSRYLGLVGEPVPRRSGRARLVERVEPPDEADHLLDLGGVGLKLVRAVGEQAFDALIEDTKLGDALDTVRGGINRTPAAAVRLFRIRSRLAAMKAKKK